MSNAMERGWGDPRRADFKSKNIVRITAGGISLNVHRDAADLFKLFITIITNKGYNLSKSKDDWGFIVRPIRGYEKEYSRTKNLRYLSNHSYGTAIDINSITNPMTSDNKVHTDMPKFVIEAAYLCGLDWGGNYKGKRKDPMHFEITTTRAAAIAKTKELKIALEKLAA